MEVTNMAETKEQMIINAELNHATYTSGTLRAWVIAPGTYDLDCLYPVTITIGLRAGHSANDHLFDRNLRRAAEALEERPVWRSVRTLKSALYRTQKSYEGVAEITVERHHSYALAPTARPGQGAIVAPAEIIAAALALEPSIYFSGRDEYLTLAK